MGFFTKKKQTLSFPFDDQQIQHALYVVIF